mgnify:CR=1 FL=1
MTGLSQSFDLMALWFATLIISSILCIGLYAKIQRLGRKILRLSGKLVSNNAEIAELRKTVEDTVKSIDKTLYSIMDEMGQSSTPSLAARWSLNPPVDSCVIDMVEDWMDNAISEEPDDKKPDQHGIDWKLYGNYKKYPVQSFDFKCLQGKDPKTWPLLSIDEGSIVPTESGSVCNV